MKKLCKLSLLVFVPIIVGAVLLIIGSNTNSETLADALADAGIKTLSIGIPVTLFAVVVVGIVLIITGKIDLSDRYSDRSRSSSARSKTSETAPASPDTATANTDTTETAARDDGKTPNKTRTPSEVELERAEIDSVNTAYGRESQLRQAEYTARHVAKNYKYSTSKQKVFGWLFFGLLMTDFALIIVFASIGIWIGAIVCFSLFGGTLIISLIVVKTKEHISLRGGTRKTHDSPVYSGKIKACLLSSSSSVGGGRRISTTRITSVTYHAMIVSDSDGKEYSAYTKKFYEENEPVNFQIIGTHGAASIVD